MLLVLNNLIKSLKIFGISLHTYSLNTNFKTMHQAQALGQCV